MHSSHVSSERNDSDGVGLASAGWRPERAGLRMRPADAEPTGLFVVVEMTVLVLVAALAMASIIVASNEIADAAAVAPTAQRAELPGVRDARVGDRPQGTVPSVATR